jgi:hypothetical protein
METNITDLNTFDLDISQIRSDVVENLFYWEAMLHETTNEIFHLISFGVDAPAFVFRKAEGAERDSVWTEFHFEPIAVMFCEQIAQDRFEANFYIDPIVQNKYSSDTISAMLRRFRDPYNETLNGVASPLAWAGVKYGLTANFFVVDDDKRTEYRRETISAFAKAVSFETMLNVLWVVNSQVDPNSRWFLRNSPQFRETVKAFIASDSGTSLTALTTQLVWGMGLMLDALHKSVEDNPDAFSKPDSASENEMV